MKKRSRTPPDRMIGDINGDVYDKELEEIVEKKSKPENDAGIVEESNGKGWMAVERYFPLFPEKKVAQIICRRGSGPEDYEYFVRWKYMSRKHWEWVKRDAILAENRLLMARADTKAEKNALIYGVEAAADPNTFVPEDEYVPERILASAITSKKNHDLRMESGDDPEDKLYFLIKWAGLAYSECTWERADEIDLPKDIVDNFFAFNPVAAGSFYGAATDPVSLAWDCVRMPVDIVKEIPPAKEGLVLRSYQVEGVNWLLDRWSNRICNILADEMGLGKTAQALTALRLLKEKYRVPGPFLIIAPMSTIEQWKREAGLWTNFNTVVFHGTKDDMDVAKYYEFFQIQDPNKDLTSRNMAAINRRSVRENPFKFDLLITTYETLVKEHSFLKNVHWRYVFLDEGHRYKNDAGLSRTRFMELNVEHVTILTGTPIQNNISELWSLLNILDPKKYGNRDEFLRKYDNPTSAEQVEDVQEILRPLLLRRLKSIVQKDIPKKEETIIEVEMTTLQKPFYRAIFERNHEFFQSLKKINKHISPLFSNISMEMRKCCNHPYLIDGVERTACQDLKKKDYAAVQERMINVSGKLLLIDKLLPKLRESKHKVLIFSQMTRMLDILQDFLVFRNYPFERLDGSVPQAERQKSIDRFTNDPDAFVFLLCTRAGGVGLNLQAADTVIIYDSDWNPQNDIQAQSRCHRIGQTKDVKVYRLLTRRTYEADLFSTASRKLGLDQAILSKGGTQSRSKTDRERMNFVLRAGAYGIIHDDEEATKAFVEADIDTILEKNTKVVSYNEDEGEDSLFATFNLASFCPTDASNDIDISDPNFWDKVADDLPQLKEAEKLHNMLGKGMRKHYHAEMMKLGSDEDNSEDSSYEGEPGSESSSSDDEMDDISDTHELHKNKIIVIPGRKKHVNVNRMAFLMTKMGFNIDWISKETRDDPIHTTAMCCCILWGCMGSLAATVRQKLCINVFGFDSFQRASKLYPSIANSIPATVLYPKENMQPTDPEFRDFVVACEAIYKNPDFMAGMEAVLVRNKVGKMIQSIEFFALVRFCDAHNAFEIQSVRDKIVNHGRYTFEFCRDMCIGLQKHGSSTIRNIIKDESLCVGKIMSQTEASVGKGEYMEMAHLFINNVYFFFVSESDSEECALRKQVLTKPASNTIVDPQQLHIEKMYTKWFNTIRGTGLPIDRDGAVKWWDIPKKTKDYANPGKFFECFVETTIRGKATENSILNPESFPLHACRQTYFRCVIFMIIRTRILPLGKDALAVLLKDFVGGIGFPAWWNTVDHEIALLEACNKHGVCPWLAIANDNGLTLSDMLKKESHTNNVTNAVISAMMLPSENVVWFKLCKIIKHMWDLQLFSDREKFCSFFTTPQTKRISEFPERIQGNINTLTQKPAAHRGRRLPMERWDLCKGLSVLDLGFEDEFKCQDICCPYGFSSVRTFLCTENVDRPCQYECTIDSVTGEFAVKEVCSSKTWKGSDPTKPWSKIVEAVNTRLTLMDKGFTLDVTKMDGFEMFGLSHPTIVKFLADTKKVVVEEKPSEDNLGELEKPEEKVEVRHEESEEPANEDAEAKADTNEQNAIVKDENMETNIDTSEENLGAKDTPMEDGEKEENKDEH